MAFEEMSARDQDIVLRCMKATAEHVADSEKHARLGLEPDELKRVIAQWPNIDDSNESESGFLAINNCLNEVCHGFHMDSGEWGKWFDIPKAEIKRIYRIWLSLREVGGRNP
jgi:hypothetical protein